MTVPDLKAYGKGVESLSDRQVFFLAVMLTSLSETLRATTETALAEIRSELAEMRRMLGGRQ